MFQNLCRRKKTRRKNQPTTKTKSSTQLPEDLKPPGIFVSAGKVWHDFRHQLNDMPLLQGRDVFFSQLRMGITRTTTLPLLCCFWEESSSVVDLTRNHNEDIRAHYALQSFSVFFSSTPWAVPFYISLFPFCRQLFSLDLFSFLSPTVSLKHSRKAGLPQSARWWASDKAVPVGKFASASR